MAAIALLGAAPAPQSRAEEPFSLATTPGKLPKDIVPHAYVIHVSPDPVTPARCSGNETVEIEVVQPTAKIVLNAADLEVTSAGLQALEPGASAAPLQPQADAGDQTVAFALPKELARGKYRLSLAFHYRLHDLSQGLYLEHYDAPGGQEDPPGHADGTDRRPAHVPMLG